jgi:hypothetical protein
MLGLSHAINQPDKKMGMVDPIALLTTINVGKSGNQPVHQITSWKLYK